MASAHVSGDAAEAPRQYVDFNTVPQSQREIDARLVNWGRWSLPGGLGLKRSPMFELYRSADPLRQYGSASAQPVDQADAERVQRAMVELTGPQRLALSWCYIRRNNPRRAAETIGVSLQGLRELIDTGRQALMARL